MSDKRNRDYDYTSSTDILNRKPTRSFSMKGQKPPEVKLRSILTKAITHFERATEDEIRAKYIKEMWEVVEASWQLPVIGRDLAYEISDTLRREKIVAFLITSLQIGVAAKEVQRECARLLSQILTTENRHYVSKNALEILTKYTQLREDIDMTRVNVGILESLFKDSEITSTRLIDLGALDTVIYACRHEDLWTARHCSAALANAAIFGGSINHKRMVDKDAPNWLFPLAFRTDDFCRFYACLAVTVLAANPLVETAVVKSGTLELVEPFVQSHDPYEFAQANPSHAQGRSASFLQRMIPLLISSRPEAQALASFYFAMEASIKAKQQKTQIFSEVSAIIPLKRVIATSRSSVARVLAARCLKIIGEDVPRKLSPQIQLWDMDDVQSWLTVAGFRGFHAAFRSSTVDGEMLLLLTEKELREDLEMRNNVHRKRFMRDLNRLRAGADYRSLDTSGICEWLRQIDPKFPQYTYRLLQAGVDRSFLHLLTDSHLRDDCGVENGVHRTRILSAIQGLPNNSESTDELRDPSHIHDVFISYRRNNGSHLASLLKVHLQVRGFRVFLDVDSLQEGDFAVRTLKSVKAASAGFILILTAGALDRCAIDHEGTDWVHKEIVTAIANRRNIVPVTTESFQWPLPDDLPQDIAPICFYNGVKWVHEYQDACVDKLVRFLKGQDPPSSKLSRIASIQSGRSGIGVSQKRSSHPNAAVRPSRSSDNLVETNRTRPRQRASPPGQASQASAPTLPVSRGVTGAQSASARSLDQGDGASAPLEQNPKPSQYQPKAKSPPSKTPDLATGGAKKTITSLSSASTASTSSSKNMAIKKDIIRLDEVVISNQHNERSHESDSDVSSDYSSDDESEGWEPEEERGGADGKSKPDGKAVPVSVKKPSPANIKTVVAQVERTPEHDVTPKPSMRNSSERSVSKSSLTPSSPDRKPSSKYKAPQPPPPSYDAHKDYPSLITHTPEPDRRPTPTPRPGSAIKDAPLTSRSEPGGARAQENGVKNKEGGKKPVAAKSTPNVTSEPDELRAGTSKSTVATASKPVVVDKKLPAKNPPNDSPNMVKKPPRSAPLRETRKSVDSKSSSEDTKSLSEYSESSSLSDPGRRSNGPRTNADGNDGASSSLTRSSVSTPSDLHKSADEIPKEVNGNTNNNNNVNSNGVEEGVQKQPSPSPKTMPSRPAALSRNPNARSAPQSRSSHSLVSSDTHSPPRSPTKSAPPGAGKPVARRDMAPPNPYAPSRKKSASERLQLTRPPPPNYPIGGGYQPGMVPPQKGYNMEQYKAAMAQSIRAPYPGHQVYPHSSGHPHPKGRPAHGFDTAV